MAVRHDRSNVKKTGGKIKDNRKSRKYDSGTEFSSPELGEHETKKKDSRGNTEKTVLRKAETANLAVDGEIENVDIQSVVENPANDNYVRRSLLTKGAVLDTSQGKARITSRPGQDGTINAVPVED